MQIEEIDQCVLRYRGPAGWLVEAPSAHDIDSFFVEGDITRGGWLTKLFPIVSFDTDKFRL